LVDAGILQQADIDLLKRMLDDPEFHFVCSALFAAGGREPTV
jgi:hypothetical protein